MLCEKAFPSGYFNSNPFGTVILEVPPVVHLCVCLCVFSLDHCFACSHSSALSIAGETSRSSQESFGTVNPSDNNAVECVFSIFFCSNRGRVGVQ